MTWQPSVQSSHLIDRESCTKVFEIFLETLGTGEDLQRFRDRCQVLVSARARVEHPGFNLLEGETYKWFLPKPHVGVADFMRIYEEFADRPLGAVPRPGDVAAKIYTSVKARRALTHLRHADQWMSPARTLLATSMWLGGEIEDNNPQRVAIRFGTGILEVLRTGCWVNGRRAFHPAACAAFDQDWPATTIASITCRNPTLQAVQEFALDSSPSLQYVGTILATALNEEIIDKQWIQAAVSDAVSPAGPTRSMVSAERAMVECSAILDDLGGNVLGDLYAAAVPNLMSSRAFRARFGVHTQGNVDRRVSAKTAQRWKQVLSEALEDAE